MEKQQDMKILLLFCLLPLHPEHGYNEKVSYMKMMDC